MCKSLEASRQGAAQDQNLIGHCFARRDFGQEADDEEHHCEASVCLFGIVCDSLGVSVNGVKNCLPVLFDLIKPASDLLIRLGLSLLL